MDNNNKIVPKKQAFYEMITFYVRKCSCKTVYGKFWIIIILFMK